MNNIKFHGVTSVAWAGGAIGLAAIALFRAGLGWGIAYLLILAVAGPAVIYAFCAKCPCQTHCAHVLPGLLARWVKRPPGPYSALELGAVGLPLLLLVGLPQLVVWRSPALGIAFWVLLGAALVQVLTVVCRPCGNVYCPVKHARR